MISQPPPGCFVPQHRFSESSLIAIAPIRLRLVVSRPCEPAVQTRLPGHFEGSGFVVEGRDRQSEGQLCFLGRGAAANGDGGGGGGGGAGICWGWGWGWWPYSGFWSTILEHFNFDLVLVLKGTIMK